MKKVKLLCITSPRSDVNYHKQVEQACLGGADMIQFRDKRLKKSALIKTARELREIAKAFNVPLILNDDPLVAHEAGCDGVHIGHFDMPYHEARKNMPFGIIGVTARSVDDAVNLSKTEADYIGIGPIFAKPKTEGPMPLGLEALKKLSGRINVPVIAIGGITADNVEDVLKAGADGVAVIKSACGAENIKAETKKIKEAIINAEGKLNDINERRTQQEGQRFN